MRITFFDAPHGEGWPGDSALAEAAPLAVLLAERGHRVRVARFAETAPWPSQVLAVVGEEVLPAGAAGPPLATAPGSHANGAAMRRAWVVLEQLRREPVDVAVLPTAGGLAFYAAMARRTGAALEETRLVTWPGEGTAARLLADDTAVEALGPLVADAMEQAVAGLVDGVLPVEACRRVTAASFDSAGGDGAGDAAGDAGASRSKARGVDEIAFLGPLTRRHGGWLAMDIAERLAARGALEGRTVRFVGPARERGLGLTKETLGIRARRWDFRWRLDAGLSRAAAVASVARTGTLLVACGPAMTELLEVAARRGAEVVQLAARDAETVIEARRAAVTMEAALAGATPEPSEPMAPTMAPASSQRGDAREAIEQLATFLETVTRTPQRETGPTAAHASTTGVSTPAMSPPLAGADPAVSVCIVTRDRPRLLERAWASLEAQSLAAFETIVVDDASSEAEQAAVLARVRDAGNAKRPVSVLCNTAPYYPAGARNRAAAAARGRHLVFLDDDNVVVRDGLARLLTAIERGGFDIVVSCLDAYAGEVPLGTEVPPPEERLLFIGDARAAGLACNLFGDTAMIVRRDAYLRIGGFPDPGYAAPAEDWAFLALAAARGLVIGVLVEPAFRYHRPAGVLESGWRKRNQEGALRRVLDIYRYERREVLDLALASGQRLVHQELGF
jgi:GT2 family glycosyltransferase